MSFSDIPSTNLMSLREWADAAAFALDDVGPIQRLDIESAWQNWAAGLCGNSGIAGKNPPSPYDFDIWQEWAERFLQAVG
jgi:hypothetical protein